MLGVICASYLGNTPLGLFVMMDLVMLIGIAVNDAILIGDYARIIF